MAKGSGFAAAVAEGINGYIRGVQLQNSMDKDAEERTYRKEQIDNARTDRARADDERRQLQSAAAPVEVQQGAGGYTKPDTADNRDVGQPGDVGQAAGGLVAGVTVQGKGYTDPTLGALAAKSANAPDAVAERTADAYRRIGKPMEATQLETANTQGKLGKLQLAKHEEDFLNEKWDKRLAGITDPKQLAEILSGSQMVGGAAVSLSTSADGKKATLMKEGPDGTLVPLGKEFDNNARGMARMITSFSQGLTAAQRISALQHFDDHDEQMRQFGQTLDLHKATLAETQRHAKAMEGNAAATLGIHQQTLQLAKDKAALDLKNDPFHNIPGGVKLRVQGLQQGINAVDSAINKAMAENGDPNGPGIKRLQEQRAAASVQLNKLLDPYLPKDGPGAAGWDAFSGGGAPKPAPGAAKGGIAPPATMVGGAVRQPDGSWTAQGSAPAPSAAAAGLPQATAATAPVAATATTAAPAKPAPGAGADPLLTALGANDPSMASVMAPRVQAIRQATGDLKSAQAAVVSAARSQDPNATARATQVAQQAGAAIDKLLADMNPQQAQQVRAALGV